MASTRTILNSSSPILVMSDGSIEVIGPLTTTAVTNNKITGNVRVVDTNDLPFEISLAGITNPVAVADPTLKGMVANATGGATSVGLAIGDDFFQLQPGVPNPQYSVAETRANLDSISFANQDKLSTVATLTSGLMTSTGFNFSGGNNFRTQLAIPQKQLHGCMYWHNGNPSGWAPTASTVKGQLDIINNAYKKNWDDNGYTAALQTLDAVNEIVDNAVSDYVKVSPLTTAFRNSTDWANEIAPFGITTDPGAFGWLYMFNKALSTWGTGVKYAIGDFGIAENTGIYGFGTNADSWFAGTAHQIQRQERFYFNVRTGMRAQAAGYPGRIDGVNFQSHMSPGRMIVPNDLRWRNYEANALGLGITLGEVNLLLDNSEDDAILTGLGITRGSPEEYVYHTNYMAYYLALCMQSTANLVQIQSWTDKTDFANGAKNIYRASDGAPDILYRAIQKAMQINPTKNAIRASRILFAKPTGFRPYELEGTSLVNNSSGLRGTNVKMPWNRFLRKDTADGVVKPYNSAKNEQTLMFVRSGANAAVANGRLAYFEDSGGAVVLTVGFNSNADVVIITSAGTMTLTPSSSNGDYFRVGLQYQNGILKACLARRNSSGVFTPAGPVQSQTVSLPAFNKVGYVDGTSVSTVVEHRVYDETHISATDTDFQNRVTIPTDYGSPTRSLAIYNGTALTSL